MKAGRVIVGALAALLAWGRVCFAETEKVGDFTYTYSVSDGKATLSGISPRPAGHLTIPASLGGLPVVCIGEMTFHACGEMKSVTIPYGIMQIDDWAFTYCHSLTNVTFPASVTNIGYGAFIDCMALANITVPDSVAAIEFFAFENTRWYNTHPDGVVYAGRVAYAHKGVCPSHVTIREGTVSITERAFSESGTLTSITIPASVKMVGYSVFKNDDALKMVFFKGDAPVVDDGLNSLNPYGCNHFGEIVYVKQGSTGWNGPGSTTLPDRLYDAAMAYGDPVAVALDPEGGELATLSMIVPSTGMYTGLPTPARSGYVFKGWWTEDNGTGTLITEGLSVTNASDHTLYAKWAKFYKLTVIGGVIDGEENNPVWVPEGDYRWVFSTVVDGETFERWIVYPNTVDLGTHFNLDAGMGFIPRYPAVRIRMPAADVTLKANYQPSVGIGWFSVFGSGNQPGLEFSDILWSIDQTVWTPANYESGGWTVGIYYPLKQGTYTVSYRSVSLHWLAPTNQTITITPEGYTDINVVATYVPLVSWRTGGEGGTHGGTVAMSPANGQVLPGKRVVLKAIPANDYVFAGWEGLADMPAEAEHSSTLAVTPTADTVYTARFRLKTELEPPVIQAGASTEGMVGVAYRASVGVNDGAWPVSFSATGLPPGLKIDSATGLISGVPARSGTFSAVIRGANLKGTSAPRQVVFTVSPLPVWASGTFSGIVDKGLGALGNASVSVTKQGAATGKFMIRGTNFSFSAKNYASCGDDGSLVLVATAKVGKVSWPLSLSVKALEMTSPNPSGFMARTLSKAEGAIDGSGWLSVYRNIWGDAESAMLPIKDFSGYYTATLPGSGEFGSGYLAFTVDSAGGVKTAGKLADGRAVSLTGKLILDEKGRIWTVLYTAPTAYKGGYLFGVAEFAKTEKWPVVVRPLDGSLFQWVNSDPYAALNDGGGFARDLTISGGMYNSLINLYNYYVDGLVVAGVDQVPWLTTTFTVTDWNPTAPGKISYTGPMVVAASYSPNGLGLSVLPETGEIVPNTSGLDFKFIRSTGLFRGSFQTWYDYDVIQDFTTYVWTTRHTVKTISFEGAMTPVREAGDAEGRGFILWTCNLRDVNPEKDAHVIQMSSDFQLMSQ